MAWDCTAFTRLRHLDLINGGPAILPHLPAHLATLTHLTLYHVPPDPPDFATAYPALASLQIAVLPPPEPASFLPLVRALSPVLTHFCTDDHLGPAALALLPDRLASLTVPVQDARDLAAIRARWFPQGHELGGDLRSSGLGVLTMMAMPWHMLDERALGAGRWGDRARVEVAALRAAGCEVEFR